MWLAPGPENGVLGGYTEGDKTVTGEVGELRLAEKKLRFIAAKITSDVELQKDLVQEMLMHLVRTHRIDPDKTPAWYLKSCEFHARNYLRLGRSIDSYKRSNGGNRISYSPNGDDDDFFHEVFFHQLDSLQPQTVQNECAQKDLSEMIVLRLTEAQRRVLALLMHGMGVREVARKLGISHPAVIKHRKKIAQVARQYLDDSATTVHAQEAE